MITRLFPGTAGPAVRARSAPAASDSAPGPCCDLGRPPRCRPRLSAAALAGLCLLAAAPRWEGYGGGALLAAQEAPAAEIELAIEQGLLTLSARDAPLADVVRAIGEERGFKVVIKGELDSRVSESFVAVPLEEGIRRLIGDTSAVLIYAPSRNQDERQPLAEIMLYGAASGERAPPAPQDPRLAASPSLLADLAGQDPAARAGAVRRLAGEKGEAAVGLLVKVLAKDEDAAVRVAAVDTLGRLAAEPGAARSTAALVDALADDDGAVRLRAVRALSKVGGSEAVAAVAAALAEDPDARVRQVAAWTLGRIGSARARAALEVAADSDPEAAVRRKAESILQQWED